jgi:hypothetical protein
MKRFAHDLWYRSRNAFQCTRWANVKSTSCLVGVRKELNRRSVVPVVQSPCTFRSTWYMYEKIREKLTELVPRGDTTGIFLRPPWPLMFGRRSLWLAKVEILEKATKLRATLIVGKCAAFT